MSFLGSPFRNQHTIIRARLADVLERTTVGFGPDLAVLFERLALALRSHLLMEDNVVYPAMIASRDGLLRDRAKRLHGQYGDQAARFDDLYAKWGGRRLVDAEIGAFVEDLDRFSRALGDRMDAEDAQLYARAPEEQRESA